jgi:HEPN domain-containing protein
MRQREHAELLLHKAQQDEFALEKLIPDPASPDEIIGFHAQQAVEKMLKAVLTNSAVYYRRTHNLDALLGLLRDNSISFPGELEDVGRLTPFAARFRYVDMAPELGKPFDRVWARECVRKVRTWAESALREKQTG